MGKTTTQLRALWKDFECADADMVLVPFGPDKIRVAPPTTQAWEALAAVLMHHRYEIRTDDTDSYNCRKITGGSGRSLHSYGIALDVNWTTNPFEKHPAGKERAVRFSNKATQALRALDVKSKVADTDMTPEMIADVDRVATKSGVRVFEWGGSWRSLKDCMHFELDVGPAELAAGIDTTTVVGWDAAGSDVVPVSSPVAPVSSPIIVPGASDARIVLARSGLRLRSGADRDADIIRTLPEGTRVFVLQRRGEWAIVDLEGDGRIDGAVSADFLGPVTAARTDGGEATVTAAAPQPGAAAAMPGRTDGTDITGRIDVDMVAAMFPLTPKAKITANLPFVLAGLRARSLGDRPMVLMALSTIRAETEGFVPISEGQSRFNTTTTPFDRYDAGTSIGADLGNTQRGDGPRFKGRGYVQLTGRSNYTRIGQQLGEDLVGNPDRANDPATAGLILAQFLKNREGDVRHALASENLRRARRLVNGGSHGFDRFADAFARGARSLPA